MMSRWVKVCGLAGLLITIPTGNAAAQPSRLRLSACQLFAELDPYYRGITDTMLRAQIEQIYERSKVDRDPKIQDAAFELYKATVFSRDIGERVFSTPERKLAQMRRDIVDPMTAVANLCNPRSPSRALTPSETDAQTKRATDEAGPGKKCETKTYGGGAVTVCE